MNDICMDCQFALRCGCKYGEHEYKLEACRMYELAAHNEALIQESERLRRRIGTLMAENQTMEVRVERIQQQAAELEAENRSLIQKIK